ncbi:MAG: hypothetical protein LBR71_03465 [Synergistaceae bacterium]|jgi:shikimate kinase|nr:hypothetical protein [Synergistaceae bacterium]
MDNYILTGIPDSGKSTLGRKAAEILGMGFYDTDVLAEERASKKRRLVPMSPASTELLLYEETKVLEELLKTAKRSIIAAGAEAPLGGYNISIIKKLGTIIYIKRDPDVIIADMRENKRNTLVLENMDTHEIINIRERAVIEYAKCLESYELFADIILDNNGGEDAGVEQLVAVIKKNESERSI